MKLINTLFFILLSVSLFAQTNSTTNKTSYATIIGRANLHEKPQEHSRILATLDSNNRVLVVESAKPYSKVKYSSQTGYILSSKLKKEEQTSQQKNNSSTPTSSTKSSSSSSSTKKRKSNNSSSIKSYSSTCGAPTKKGGSCRRKVSGGGRCWQH